MGCTDSSSNTMQVEDIRRSKLSNKSLKRSVSKSPKN